MKGFALDNALKQEAKLRNGLFNGMKVWAKYESCTHVM